jgi:hypothetical protein
LIEVISLSFFLALIRWLGASRMDDRLRQCAAT